jgi:hypothetical protein
MLTAQAPKHKRIVLSRGAERHITRALARRAQ